VLDREARGHAVPAVVEQLSDQESARRRKPILEEIGERRDVPATNDAKSQHDESMTEYMNDLIPPDALKQIRHLLASAISDTKAYGVPALCRRLNLADGTEEEAFASKYKYAQKRLADVPALQVIESAKALVTEEAHFELSEQLAKIEELRGPDVTTLTRRRLIALFDGRPLSTEIDDIDLIRSVWPIARIVAPIQGTGHTLEDDITRHTIRNDDLTQRELLEALGLLTCSRLQLFKFLAAVTASDGADARGPGCTCASNRRVAAKGRLHACGSWEDFGQPALPGKADPIGSPADESISATLAAFDPDQVHSRWMAASIDARPSRKVRSHSPGHSLKTSANGFWTRLVRRGRRPMIFRCSTANSRRS
jgi:hypothetical protein